MYSFNHIQSTCAKLTIFVCFIICAQITSLHADPLIWNDHYDEAIDHYLDHNWKAYIDVMEKAVDAADKIKNSTDSVKALLLSDLAIGYQMDFQLDKAEFYQHKAYTLRSQIFPKGHVEIGESLLRLGDLHAIKGNYLESEQFYKTSIEIDTAEHHTASRFYILHLNGLGNLYLKTARYAEADQIFNKMLATCESHWGRDDLDYALGLVGMSKFYQHTGDLNSALTEIQNAIEIIEEEIGDENNRYAQATEQQARLYIDMNRHQDAIALLQNLLDHYRNRYGDKHIEYLDVLFLLTSVELDHIKDPFLIEKHIKSVLSGYQRAYGNIHRKTLVALTYLGRFHYANDQKALAVNTYLKVAEYYLDFQKLHFEKLGEFERRLLNQDIHNFFQEFTNLAIAEAKNYPELLSILYNLQITQKALLMNTSNEIKKRVVESGDKKLVKLYKEVINIKSQVAQASKPEIQGANSAVAKKDSLVGLLRTKDRELTSISKLYQKKEAVTTWKDIQKHLRKKEALVEIIRYREFDFPSHQFSSSIQYAALVINSTTLEHPQLIRFENGNYLEKSAVQYYREQINTQSTDTNSYDQFWKPLESIVKGAEVVHIVPDGVFHQINLLTLFDSKTKRFLFETTVVKQHTNSKDIISSEKPGLPYQLAVLVGNPAFNVVNPVDNNRIYDAGSFLDMNVRGNIYDSIPGTELEVLTIQKMLKNHKWKNITLLREQAREATLKKIFKPKVLHLATHGYFEEPDADHSYNSDNPLFRSGLLLSGSTNTLKKEHINRNFGQEDGILTAFEAMHLNVDNTELVVLSACETGLGEIVPGEGVYNMQRAFRAAGARTVLMSLWKVNDQTTKELMVAFYKYWLGGMEKRKAFTRAMINLKSKYPHPYFWGAFVMIGE